MLIDLLWKMSRPFLFSMEAERAHDFVLNRLSGLPRLHATMLGLLTGQPDPKLAVQIGPLQLAGPVGLAAGLDKNGVAIPVWAAMGFGFVEVGTVTPRPQDGNPQPRMFRLVHEKGIINRMGFNNRGTPALVSQLQALRSTNQWPAMPVGANIGKNKDTPLEQAGDDYLKSVRLIQNLADYLTVNVSSPNTPGLRELQRPDRLEALLRPVVEEASPRPVFLKLAPDLDLQQIKEAVEVAIATQCAGLIATNTTIQRPGSTDRRVKTVVYLGHLRGYARERIEQVLQAADDRLPIIGVGGIRSPE